MTSSSSSHMIVMYFPAPHGISSSHLLFASPPTEDEIESATYHTTIPLPITILLSNHQRPSSSREPQMACIITTPLLPIEQHTSHPYITLSDHPRPRVEIAAPPPNSQPCDLLPLAAPRQLSIPHRRRPLDGSMIARD